MIPFWLPWFKVGGSLIKAYSHQVSTAMLAGPLGCEVKVQFTAFAG